MPEAELEDLYDSSFYEELVKNLYRVTLKSPKFKTKKKWSDRMRDVFRLQGKRWNDQVEMELKRKIAELVSNNPETVLHDKKRTSFDGLVMALEDRLTELNKSR